MMPPAKLELEGSRGQLVVHTWSSEECCCVVLLAHAFGHLAPRYTGFTERIVAAGAAVYAPQYAPRPASNGDAAPVLDAEELAHDLHLVAARAHEDYPELPVYVIG